MSDVTMISRFQGCLLGVAIGDAMGMPWEIMTHEEIFTATKGSGVTNFVDPVQRKIKETMHLKAGDTTDDWQLTAANARSLIRYGGYNHVGCAGEHIDESRKSRFGWGKTTQVSIERIADLWRNTPSAEWKARGGFQVPEAQPIKSEYSGVGCGNGVAIKIPPIALFRYLHDGGMNAEGLWETVRLHGSMTHSDIRASIAAYALALTIQTAIDPNYRTQKYILKFLYEACTMVEARYSKYDLNVSDVIAMIRKDDLRILNDPDQLRSVIGTGCLSLESVPFAIATYLRNPQDFRAGVLEAVNAGGDTDSTASMVGGLIGANCGLDAIPQEWRTFRPEYETAVKLGAELYWAHQCRVQ